MRFLYCVITAWAGRKRAAFFVAMLLTFCSANIAAAQTTTRCTRDIAGTVTCNTEPNQQEKIRDAVEGINRWKENKKAEQIAHLTADWNDEARRFDAPYHSLAAKDRAGTLNTQALLWGNLAVKERREAQFDGEKALELQDKKALAAAVLRIQSARLLLERADAEPAREVAPEGQ